MTLAISSMLRLPRMDGLRLSGGRLGFGSRWDSILRCVHIWACGFALEDGRRGGTSANNALPSNLARRLEIRWQRL